MALIPWPTCAFIRSVEWTPPDPDAQVNASEWTGSEQTTVLPFTGRWHAIVKLEPKMSEDTALSIKAWRVDMKGVVNQTRIPATDSPQFVVAVPLQVNGANQTGYQLNVEGGPNGVKLKRGHLLTIADQLVMNMADVTFTSTGRATLTLSNPLRISPADNLPIEAVNPTCRVKLHNPTSGWTYTYPRTQDFTQFEVVEAIRP